MFKKKKNGQTIVTSPELISYPEPEEDTTETGDLPYKAQEFSAIPQNNQKLKHPPS